MRSLKRIFAFLLVVFLVNGFMPLSAYAAYMSFGKITCSPIAVGQPFSLHIQHLGAAGYIGGGTITLSADGLQGTLTLPAGTNGVGPAGQTRFDNLSFSTIGDKTISITATVSGYDTGRTTTVTVKHMPEISGSNDLTLVKDSNTTVSAAMTLSGADFSGGGNMMSYSGLYEDGAVYDQFTGNHTVTPTGIYKSKSFTSNAAYSFLYSSADVGGLAPGEYSISGSIEPKTTATKALNLTNYGVEIGKLSIYAQPTVSNNFSYTKTVGGFTENVTVPVNVSGGPFDGSFTMTAELGSTGKTATATVSANGVVIFALAKDDLNALSSGSYPILVSSPTTGYNNALAATEVGTINAGNKNNQAVTITPDSVSANVGDTGKSVVFGYNNTETPTVTVTSSNPGVATADSAGNLTIGNAGTATITVKVAETGNYWAGSASFIVNVGKTTPSVTWPAASTINYGESLSASTLTGGSADVSGVSVPGSFDWADPLEVMTASGSRAVIFTPTNTSDYETVTSNVSVSVRGTDKAITGFTLAGVDGSISDGAGTIQVQLPYGTDVTSLAPTIQYTGASVSPASGAAQDFTNPVTYTVTADDGTSKDYVVSVTVASPVGDRPSVSTNSLSVVRGGTDSFSVSLGYSDNAAASATVTSADPAIATADPGQLTASGAVTVTGVSAGNTTISLGYSGGSRHGQTDTVQVTVSEPYTPPAQRPSRDRDSDSGTAKTWTPPVPQATEYIIDKAEMEKLMATADKNGWDFVRSSSGLPTTVKAEAWKLPADKFIARTVTDKAVQVQLTFPEPNKIMTDMKVSGWMKSSIVDNRKAFFEKWYVNKLRIIHLDHTGSFGQAVEIAAKVDLNGMDTKELYFYSYDKATNSYKRIEKAAYWIDRNGYLHFTTELAADIVVSEGALEKK